MLQDFFVSIFLFLPSWKDNSRRYRYSGKLQKNICAKNAETWACSMDMDMQHGNGHRQCCMDTYLHYACLSQSIATPPLYYSVIYMNLNFVLFRFAIIFRRNFAAKEARVRQNGIWPKFRFVTKWKNYISGKPFKRLIRKLEVASSLKRYRY
jgi:hypothetical protein